MTTQESLIRSTTLQVEVPDFLQDTIANIIAFIPAIIGAVIILLIGWVLGRIFGGITTRVLEKIGLSDHARRTPLENGPDTEGSIASAIGTLVAYIVYFYAALAAADVLGIEILSESLSEIGAFLPVIFSAAVILVIGFIIGQRLGDIVAEIVRGFGLRTYIRGTPLENVTTSAGGIGTAAGKLVEYAVYFFALLTAADTLGITALSQLLNDFAAFVPALIGGLLVLVVGVFIADALEDIVASVDASRLTTLAGIGVKLLIYYITITIALDTIGFSTAVLTTLFTAAVTAFFGALGVALALAIAIGVGWGSKDYVAENIDDWMANVRRSISELGKETDTRSTDDYGSSDPTSD
ncbi:phosphatase [Natronococcus sp. JC468]|uniref:mechanosensitive ion channel family protein n=1 Tax=Natronococcus sp. JC468 TaxID=1961921 RepID=UPI00143CA4B7|nr:phosphatase [Natronococcus sp. JC468]NKE38035.1 phosphatase [Natronococcus sp. JC468]